MKYKVGERVRIKKDLENSNSSRINDIGTITYILKNKPYCYEIEFKDKQKMYYCDEELELVEEKQDIIEYKGEKYTTSEEVLWCSLGKTDRIRLTLTPYQREILDKKEKEYLKAVIKPFRNKIYNITKRKNGDNTEFIEILLEKYDVTDFPDFLKGTMYKNMEVNRPYAIKDLGL